METIYVGDGKILFFPTTSFIDNRPWFYLDAKDVRLTPLIILGQYETSSKKIIDDINTGDTFIDVGANIGWYAMHAGRKVGPAGKVIAIEPHPRVFDILRMNMETNSYTDRMILYPSIISDSNPEGSKFWFDNDFTVGSHLIGVGTHPKGNDGNELLVNCMTLDQIYSEYGKGLYTYNNWIIKIDVEGAEYKVWRGMQNIVKEIKNLKLFIELHEYVLGQEGCNKLKKEIQDAGFEVHEDDKDSSSIMGDRKYIYATKKQEEK